MLGVIYTAASDFSSFSYPRARDCLDLCLEAHHTPIEQRYCPKRHVDISDEREWDALMQTHVRHIDELGLAPTTVLGKRCSLTINTALDSLSVEDDSLLTVDGASSPLEVPPSTPISACTTGTPSLIGGDDDAARDEESSSESESDFDLDKVKNKRLTLAVMAASNRKRTKRRGKTAKRGPRHHSGIGELKESRCLGGEIYRWRCDSDASKVLFRPFRLLYLSILS